MLSSSSINLRGLLMHGPTEKNKTRQKYMTSIPLQENQSLARSTNLDLHKSGKGNSLRPRSRAQCRQENSPICEPPTETELVTRACLYHHPEICYEFDMQKPRILL